MNEQANTLTPPLPASPVLSPLPSLPRVAIDTQAMLMEFNASVWTARKLDKQVTEETNINKEAAKNASRVNKNLLAGRVELERVQGHVADTRNWFYRITLPWSQAGARLLPAKDYFKVSDEMEKRRERFIELVGEFLHIYPTLITAQALTLGKMFNRNDFPDPRSIAKKFAFSAVYSPLPAVGDFRIAVGDTAAQEIKDAYEKVMEERVAEVRRDAWFRLHKTLTHMADRLGYDEEENDAKPRRFHDTLLSNALELCDMLQTFNVTNDPELEKARKGLEQALLGVDAKDLRKNDAVREDVSAQVQELLSKFDWEVNTGMEKEEGNGG